MQAVGHHRDVIKATQHRHHLQHRAARIENNGITVMDKLHCGIGDQRFLLGIDQRFVVDRRIGFVFIQHHAAVGSDHRSGVFQDHQILADGGTGGIKVVGQILD
ncbi:hypothetical protein D3C79_985440 [compost metagenome]